MKPGDILVGKVTPKGETQLTPEEKLLRAIFGEKAGDVKDASFYCPPGIEGTVADCKVFSRKGVELDERARAVLNAQIDTMHHNLTDEKRILTDERTKRLMAILGGKTLLADLHDEKTNKRLLSKGTELTGDIIEKLRARDLKRMKLKNKDPRLNEQIDEIEEMTSRQITILEKITEEKISKLGKGDELPPGVIKMVKVYIAMKRKLSVGDKMAGRHGNKGVVALIAPKEDMPFLPDGTPVDIILDPMGVPSRMNIGQVLGKMGEARNGFNIVILDACRDNPFAKGFRSSSRGLAVVNSSAVRGTLVAYATSPGKVASDGEARNGLYTKHLLQHIASPGLPVEQVFKRVLQSVERDTYGKQSPWTSSSFSGDFSFQPIAQ